MPRKKSIKKSAKDFLEKADDIEYFLKKVAQNQSEEHINWLYNYAIIRLYREFEAMILACLVGAINNDTSILFPTTGIEFPKHMTDEVCEYLVTGGNYFDFKGRGGLIKILKNFLGQDHFLIRIIKNDAYKDALDKLSALRNFAAHESHVSKQAALKAINRKRISSSGAWLKIEKLKQTRFTQIVDKLKKLASEIEEDAPY